MSGLLKIAQEDSEEYKKQQKEFQKKLDDTYKGKFSKDVSLDDVLKLYNNWINKVDENNNFSSEFSDIVKHVIDNGDSYHLIRNKVLNPNSYFKEERDLFNEAFNLLSEDDLLKLLKFKIFSENSYPDYFKTAIENYILHNKSKNKAIRDLIRNDVISEDSNFYDTYLKNLPKETVNLYDKLDFDKTEKQEDPYKLYKSIMQSVDDSINSDNEYVNYKKSLKKQFLSKDKSLKTNKEQLDDKIKLELKKKLIDKLNSSGKFKKLVNDLIEKGYYVELLKDGILSKDEVINNLSKEELNDLYFSDNFLNEHDVYNKNYDKNFIDLLNKKLTRKSDHDLYWKTIQDNLDNAYILLDKNLITDSDIQDLLFKKFMKDSKDVSEAQELIQSTLNDPNNTIGAYYILENNEFDNNIKDYDNIDKYVQKYNTAIKTLSNDFYGRKYLKDKGIEEKGNTVDDLNSYIVKDLFKDDILNEDGTYKNPADKEIFDKYVNQIQRSKRVDLIKDKYITKADGDLYYDTIDFIIKDQPEELSKLYNAGILTEEEVEERKKQLGI